MSRPARRLRAGEVALVVLATFAAAAFLTHGRDAACLVVRAPEGAVLSTLVKAGDRLPQETARQEPAQ